MESLTLGGIAAALIVMTFVWVLLRRRRRGDNPPNNTSPLPDIPDHTPTDPGDVKNGEFVPIITTVESAFTSLSVELDSNGLIYKTKILGDDGVQPTKASVGKWLYEGYPNENTSAIDYTYEVIFSSGTYSGPKRGWLSDNPKWTLTSAPLDPNEKNCMIYIHIHAPAGNLDGVVKLHMSILRT